MRYGIPYKGSKNSIAEWVIAELPRADTFVDLFMGGGAITHCAMLSGKYKNFIINDIDARMPQFFLDCIDGKYTTENHQEWISREEFFARKDDDAYIALIWSFGNNGKDYIYSTEIEPFKRAYHYAVYRGDYGLFEQQGINIPHASEKSIYGRYRAIRGALLKLFQSDFARAENYERLQAAENLQALQNLQALHVDYREVSIPDGALIYCDIPYGGTDCGKYDGFNHAEFYEWAKKQDNIYVSEYSMPAEDFIQVARTTKRQLSSAKGSTDLVEERLYTNKKTYYKLSKERKRLAMLNMAEQTNIFDFL